MIHIVTYTGVRVTNNSGSRSDDWVYWLLVVQPLLTTNERNSWFTHFLVHRFTRTRNLSLRYSYLTTDLKTETITSYNCGSLIVISCSSQFRRLDSILFRLDIPRELNYQFSALGYTRLAIWTRHGPHITENICHVIATHCCWCHRARGSYARVA
jgi:hypothetical protein